MSDYGLFESIQGSEGERKIASRETQRKLDTAIDDVKRQYGSFLFASRDSEEFNDRVALCKNDMIKTVDRSLMPVTGVMRRIVKACKDEWKQKRADKTGPELHPDGDWEAYLKSVDENSDAAVENCFKEGYRYYYADNGIGAAPDGQTPGTGVPPSDPISQASAAPVGIPGIQASRYLYADDTDYSNMLDSVSKDKDGKSIVAPGSSQDSSILWKTPANQDPTRGSKRTPEGDVIPGGALPTPDAAGKANIPNPDRVQNDKMGRPGDYTGGGPGPGGPGSVAPAAALVSQQSGGPGGAGPAAGPGGGAGPVGDNGGPGGGGAAERPMTTGDVADGGRAGAENGNNSAITGKDYVVQEGDTLTDIAQRGYGDMNKYDDLAKANGISNPDDISVGTTIKALDGSDFSGNNNIPGNLTNPAGGGVDNNISTADAGPSVQTGAGGLSTANGFAGGAPGLTPPPAKVGSLALAQYMDWCDSFGMRRASIDSLDRYAANLNDQAYFEIASALTDPSSPIYRMSADGNNLNPFIDSGDSASADQGNNTLNPFIGGDSPAGGQGGNQLNPFIGSPPKTGRRRTAAPDYLQKADEALTNLLNQKAEEFQETIAPLQQALQTVQQAEQAQAAMNPMGVQPPAGTVNVLPQQPGGDPNAAAGGGDPSGGMDPAMMAQLMGGGGDPSQGGDQPPMDPSQMQMQARRKRQVPLKKARGAKAPHHAGIVTDVDEWSKQRGVTTGNPEVDMAQFQSETGKPIGPKQRNKLTKPVSTATPMPKSKKPISVGGMPKKASGSGCSECGHVSKNDDELEDHWWAMHPDLGEGPDWDQADAISAEGGWDNKSLGDFLNRGERSKKRRQANFFTRKVAGWEWDSHLNGYVATAARDFTCSCGEKHPTPSYSTCKCGKIHNSYVIGTGGDSHHASVEKFICREIPVRDGVIVANRRLQAMTDLGLNVAGSAPHPDKPIMLVYGGAFNPPHQGHVGALQDAHDTLAGAGYNVEGTIVAPTADKLLAGKQMAPEHRLNLQSRANVAKVAFPREINGAPVTVHTGPSEEVERGTGKPRRTDLAKWVQQRFPNHTIVNVTGEDATVPGAPDIHPSIYSGAPGSNHQGFAYLTMPRDPDDSMSSSKIRAALAAGQPLPGMTPESEHSYQQELAGLRSRLAAKRRSEIIKYTEDEEEGIEKSASCNCWKGYERVPGTKPCAEGSCRKCDSHRKSSGKVKRHNLSDPGPLGDGKDDKMPDINDDLGKDWYKRGPGGKYARRNRRGR